MVSGVEAGNNRNFCEYQLTIHMKISIFGKPSFLIIIYAFVLSFLVLVDADAWYSLNQRSAADRIPPEKVKYEAVKNIAYNFGVGAIWDYLLDPNNEGSSLFTVG